MIYKDDEVKVRLESGVLPDYDELSKSVTPVIDSAEITSLHKGKSESNNPPIAEGTKRLLGTLAFLDSAKAAHEQSGVSKSHISHYRNGKLGFHKPDEKSRDILKEKKEAIEESVVDKMLFAVNLLDEEKLGELTKVREITSCVKDLATIVDKFTDKAPATGLVNNLIFYSPKQREEKDYEVIDV